MSAPPPPSVIRDPWESLRRHTPARIALGRVGAGLPTAHHLAFQLDHARARDAVHSRLDPAALAAGLDAAGLAHVLVHSAAADRREYLMRPDLGRRLAPDTALSAGDQPADLVLVIADGLCATGIQAQALPLLELLRPGLAGLVLAPVVVAEQARVALADDIGERLGAALSVILIGERPGLSSTDSMGAYLTWQPRRGRTDAERNCLSNIRPQGMGLPEAAERLLALIGDIRRRRVSGCGGPVLPAL